MPQQDAPVVVGVDGSESSIQATRWAAAHAARESRRLVVLHCWSWPFPGTEVNPMPDSIRGDLRAKAEKALSEAMVAAQDAEPELLVSGELVEQPPVATLLERSKDAAVVVIGSRGLGGFSGLLLGSTGVALAGHTVSPLVVVREGGRAGGPVVFGVDDGPTADQVAETAVALASRSGASVVAVRAWSIPAILPDWPEGAVDTVKREEQFARERLDQVLATVQEHHPDVEIEHRVTRSAPASSLIDEAQDAQLVVVGSRGRGGFKGLVLGSTSHAVIHHAPCPVMIVGRHEG